LTRSTTALDQRLAYLTARLPRSAMSRTCNGPPGGRPTGRPPRRRRSAIAIRNAILTARRDGISIEDAPTAGDQLFPGMPVPTRHCPRGVSGVQNPPPRAGRLTVQVSRSAWRSARQRAGRRHLESDATALSFPRLSGGVQVIMAGDLVSPGLVGVSWARLPDPGGWPCRRWPGTGVSKLTPVASAR
jgi:hypothetical protein